MLNKLRNYLCYSVKIFVDMPFSDEYVHVLEFCKRFTLDKRRFVRVCLIECDEYIQVYVKGGSRSDWNKEYPECQVKEIPLIAFNEVYDVFADKIGEPEFIHTKI